MIVKILVVAAIVGGVYGGAKAVKSYTDRHSFPIAVLLVGAVM